MSWSWFQNKRDKQGKRNDIYTIEQNNLYQNIIGLEQPSFVSEVQEKESFIITKRLL